MVSRRRGKMRHAIIARRSRRCFHCFFGAVFATVALTGAEGVLSFDAARGSIAALVFALGLSLVLIGGGDVGLDRVMPSIK